MTTLEQIKLVPILALLLVAVHVSSKPLHHAHTQATLTPNPMTMQVVKLVTKPILHGCTNCPSPAINTNWPTYLLAWTPAATNAIYQVLTKANSVSNFVPKSTVTNVASWAFEATNAANKPEYFAAYTVWPCAVELQWVASVSFGVAGYDIYYGTKSGSYTNVTSIGNVTNTTLSGFTVGHTYYFAVSTIGQGGAQSALSKQVSYTVAPNGVLNLRITF